MDENWGYPHDLGLRKASNISHENLGSDSPDSIDSPRTMGHIATKTEKVAGTWFYIRFTDPWTYTQGYVLCKATSKDLRDIAFF